MGFRKITDRNYEFIGVIDSQLDDYGMAGVLTVMPLKLQPDSFVISLDVNGEQMVKARIAKLDDIANLVGYAGFMKDVLSNVNRKEKDDSQDNQHQGGKSTNGGSK